MEYFLIYAYFFVKSKPKNDHYLFNHKNEGTAVKDETFNMFFLLSSNFCGLRRGGEEGEGRWIEIERGRGRWRGMEEGTE
jgi:hypothetical protein